MNKRLYQVSMEPQEEMARKKKLHEALLTGCVESLKEVMQEGKVACDRYLMTCHDETPLHLAAMTGKLDIAKALLDYYKNDMVIRRKSIEGWTPLHCAAANGHVEIVKLLLEVGSDVFRSGKADRIPVHLACDKDGMTPLHLAIMNGQVNVVKELLQAPPEELILYNLDQEETVLHLSVTSNRFEVLKVLVEHYGRICDLGNVKDAKGNTILHLAAGLKQMKTIEYLLSIDDLTMKVNERNCDGFTALDIITSMQSDYITSKISRLLVAMGAERTGRLEPDIPKITTKEVQVWASALCNNARECLEERHAWVEELWNKIMVIIMLIAALSYQAGLNPPSGVWQGDQRDPEDNQMEPHYAGTSVMATNSPAAFLKFRRYNTVLFIASLTIILVRVSGLSSTQRVVMCLRSAMCVTLIFTLIFMAQTYAISILGLKHVCICVCSAVVCIVLKRPASSFIMQIILFYRKHSLLNTAGMIFVARWMYQKMVMYQAQG